MCLPWVPHIFQLNSLYFSLMGLPWTRTKFTKVLSLRFIVAENMICNKALKNYSFRGVASKSGLVWREWHLPRGFFGQLLTALSETIFDKNFGYSMPYQQKYIIHQYTLIYCVNLNNTLDFVCVYFFSTVLWFNSMSTCKCHKFYCMIWIHG